MLKILLCLLLCFASWTQAADLAWNASVVDEQHAAPDGYRIHWGSEPGVYTGQSDAGLALTWHIPDDWYGQYYFVASAYNSAGQSGYSNEVIFTRDQPQPYTGATGLRASRYQIGGHMAITVGAATSDSITGVSDTSLVVTAPAGIVDGDCLIAFAICDTDAGRTIATLSGWTALGGGAHDVGGYRAYVWFKKSASEGSSYTWTISGTYSAASIGIIRISGAVCDGASDITVAAGGNTTNDQTSECPNITTPENACLILWLEGASAQTASSCNRGGATERLDVAGGGSGDAYHLSIWTEEIASAGSVTGAVITRTGYGGNSTFAIALKTASGGGASAVPVIMRSYRARRN